MRAYVLQRILLTIPQLVGVSILVFALVRVIPGDVALLMVAGSQGGDTSARSEETVQAIRRSLDLDKPIHVQ